MASRSTPERQDQPNQFLSVPMHFGIWSRNAQHPEQLQTTLTTETNFHYRATLTMNAQAGMIEMFKMELQPGVRPAGAAPPWPDFTITGLSPQLSKTLSSILFEDNSNDMASWETSLEQAANYIIASAELDQFDFNPTFVRKRLAYGRYGSVFHAFSNLPEKGIELADLLIESLGEATDPDLAERIGRRVLRELEPFADQERSRLSNKLIEQLIDSNQLRTFACLCEPALPQKNAMFAQSPHETLLLDYASNIDQSTAERIIEAVLEHSGPQLRTGAGYYRSVQGCIEHFVERLGCIRADQREAVVYDFSEQLVLHEVEDLGLALVQTRHVGENEGDRKLRNGMTPALAFKLLKSSQSFMRSAVIANMDLFTGLNVPAMGKRLWETDRQGLIKNLRVFNGLPFKMALEIVETGKGAQALDNRRAFEMNRNQEVDLVKALLERGDVQPVLESDLSERTLERVEQDYHLLSYRKDVGLASGKIYQQYLSLKRAGDEQYLVAFVRSIDKLAKAAISSAPQNPKITEHPYYAEVIQTIYPSHVGRTVSFDTIEECSDRSSDLKRYKIRPVYTIDLAEGAKMVMAPGQQRDEVALRSVLRPILAVQDSCERKNYDQKKMYDLLDEEIRKGNGDLPVALTARAERLVGAQLMCLLGKRTVVDLKKLFVGYQFASDPNIQDYINGTQDRSRRAQTPEYVHLLELREYYADVMHDVLESLAIEAKSRGSIEKVCNYFYKEARTHAEQERIQSVINRFRPDRLGMTAAFQRQLQGILRSKNPDRRKLAGERIEAEKKKVAGFLGELTGRKIDWHRVDLKHFRPAELLRKFHPKVDPVSPQQATAWVLSRLRETFVEEIAILDREIAKYKPEDGVARRAKRLEAYITKNHTSAHARAVAGVCVALDQKQWDLPNYLQMVLRDPETRRCEGLALLHYYEDRGKKILAASFNPTSTYLYKVDGAELFHGMLGALTAFAGDNAIDFIACSRKHVIRTNRTGSPFELALKETIRQTNKRFQLSQQQFFAFKPRYVQKLLDLLWEREN